MIRKTYDGTYFKALDEGTGEFEAVVSVFGNVDLQGDRVMPGAFTKSLEKWRASGDPIPVIWSHMWGDPEAHIGFIRPEDAYEVVDGAEKAFGDGILGGLYVKGRLDIHKPFAKQVYDLLKERRVKEWSFAYDVIDEERDSKDSANNLNIVDVHEVGPTLKGANSATLTLGVKSQLEQAASLERGLKKITNALEVDNEVGLKMLKDWVAEDEARYFEAQKTQAENEEPQVEEKSEDDLTTEEILAMFDAGEKAELKPWHVEKHGDEWCVIKDTDGSTAGCHPTQEEALAQMRALYASEADKSAETDGVTETEVIPIGEVLTLTATSDPKNYTTTDSNTSTVSWTIVGEKAGRVIGAKAASSLKEALAKAVDDFVAAVNGAAQEASTETSEEEKAQDEALQKAREELEDYKRRLGILDTDGPETR